MCGFEWVSEGEVVAQPHHRVLLVVLQVGRYCSSDLSVEVESAVRSRLNVCTQLFAETPVAPAHSPRARSCRGVMCERN